MESQLVIRMDLRRDRAYVALTGQLNAVNSTSLFHQILALLHGGHPDLELDLSGVQTADPAGLGTVISAAKRAAAVGGSLHLSGVRRPVQEVMTHIGTGWFSALCDDGSFPRTDAPSHGRASGRTRPANVDIEMHLPPAPATASSSTPPPRAGAHHGSRARATRFAPTAEALPGRP